MQPETPAPPPPGQASSPSELEKAPRQGPGGRLVSVDALRGFDMFWIIGAAYFVHALEKLSDHGAVQFVAHQLSHKEWEGFAFYDLIFPLFIFIAGVSLVFSLTKALESEGQWAAHKRLFRRFVLLYAVALIYSGGATELWPNLRLMGVLNRIALCYFFAGLIFCHLKAKGMVAVCASLLIGYWALLSFVPFPDVRPVTATGEFVSERMTATNTAQLNFASSQRLHGVFEPGLNLAHYFDQKYLGGKKWDGTWDPEGLLSTLPAIATCLLGVFAGLLLRNPSLGGQQKVYYLLAAGAAGVALGFLWGLQFPIIKKLWTSSYVLVAGGYSALLLAAFYQIVEIWKWEKWTQPFIWIGANSITLYLANNIIGFRKLAERFAGGSVKQFFDRTVTAGFGDLVVALVAVGLALALAHFLYRRKIFLRL